MFQTTNQLEMLDYRTVKKMKILGLTPLRGDIFKVPLPVLAGAVRPSKDLCFKYAFKHQQQCGVYHFFLDMYIHTYRTRRICGMVTHSTMGILAMDVTTRIQVRKSPEHCTYHWHSANVNVHKQIIILQYMYMYIHIDTYIYICVYTYIHNYIHLYT